MTELLPATGDAPSKFAQNPAILTKFDDINGPFTVAYSQFLREVINGNEGGCRQLRQLVEIPSFPYGVHKNPSIVTYYAVKLSAKAKLLFNPFGRGAPVTLTAYSAAKPFGSRIGKNIGNQPSTMMYATGLQAPGSFSVALSSLKFPNLLVGIDHVSSESDGFAQREHLGYLRAIELNDITNRSGAFRVAGAYAPWELGYYTPANFAQPVDMGIFDNNPVFDNNGYYPLRAPILNPKSTDNSISFIRNIVESYLSASDLGGAGASSPFFGVMQNDYLTDDNFANLFAFMQTNGFDMNHPVLDPLLQDNPTLLAFIRGMGGERFTVAASPQGQLFQMSSWNSQKTASDVLPQSELGLGIGRSGYSVRFVSFQQLAEGGQGSTDPDSAGSFNNPLTRLGGTAGGLLNDISKIRH